MRVHHLSVAVLACVLLAGCAAEPDAGGPSASPSPRPSASASPSPEPTGSAAPAPSAEPGPTPTPPPATTTSTCRSLLDAETTQRFADSAADGWAFIPDFGQRMIDEGNPIGLFVQYGGVACQWGFPSSSTAFTYGHSAISGADAQAVKSRLTADGYSARSALGGELYCQPPELTDIVWPGCFLFVGTEWFHSSVESELEMIVSQARAG
ncbi:hypothetical protein ABIB15_001197 [Marisediminicola sp. UYEF4]|uniref:hypothetical protein n=1 Tax=Marisediminicola sp. UYEF4 TaxID=1756384 RepID=UPI0033951277